MLARTSSLAALALLAACGSDSPSATPAGADATEPDATAATEAASPERRFLLDNAARDAVTVTDSGLQYEVLRAADGPRPAADAVVTLHYVGTLIDGTEFDSSRARGEPATFPLDGTIAGFSEGVRLMSVGSLYRFVLPSELAYGDAGAGADIGPGATLVFEIELLEIGSS